MLGLALAWAVVLFAALAAMSGTAGCQELPHYGFTSLRLEGGKAFLCHHITGEELELPPSHIAVAFNSSGFGYVEWQDKSSWFAELLQSSAHASGQRVFIHNHTTDNRSWVSSQLPLPVYVPLKVGVSQRQAPIKCCQIPWHAPSLRLWWVLRDFQAPLGLTGRPDASSHSQGCKWVLDSLPIWQAAFAKLYPGSLLLKRGISRNRKSCDAWGKVLDDHTASTHGLLLVCLHRAHAARPSSLRQHAVEVLQAFLAEFFREEGVEVHIDMGGEGIDFPIGVPPSPECVAVVPVDEGRVWLQPMLSKATGPVKSELIHVLGLDTVPTDRLPPCMDLHKVLLKAWEHDAHWFLGQWLNQLALLVEIISMEKGYTENPLDLPSGFERPTGRRPDQRLVETLALGRAPSGVEAVSCHPEQHIRTYAVFNSSVLKSSAASFARMQCSILNRYLEVGRQHLSMCRVITLALDGSRFTGRDTCIGMICGRHTATGEWAAMWCPPQARIPYRNTCAMQGLWL